MRYELWEDPEGYVPSRENTCSDAGSGKSREKGVSEGSVSETKEGKWTGLSHRTLWATIQMTVAREPT